MPGTPTVLTSNAANRIRSAVTQITLASKAWGGLANSSRHSVRAKAPFELWVDPTPQDGPHIKVNLYGANVQSGKENIPVDTDNGRNASLYQAWEGDPQPDWDLGLTTNYTNGLFLVFYVVSILRPTGVTERPLANKLYWGIATGTSYVNATQNIPAIASNPTTSGKITNVIWVGWLGAYNPNMYTGVPDVVNSHYGNVNLPAYEDVDVVVKTRYNVVDHRLEEKTMRALILRGGPDTDWTMIEGGQAELYP